MPCRPREQRLRKLKCKDFMSDEGEIENEKVKYSVNRGNKYNQMKTERELRKLGTESCPDDGSKSGSRGKFSPHSKLLTPVV